MKQFKFISFAILVCSVVFVSCSKEGPAGAPGAAGATGATGTANVIYSDWYGPNLNGGTAWAGAMQFGTQTNFIDKPAAAVTAAVINQGVVLVYGKMNGYTTAIWPLDNVGLLPLTVEYGTNIDVWRAELTAGNIRVNFQNNANSFSASAMNTAYRFRYIIIPGGVAGRSASVSGYTPEQLKNMPYNLVCGIYNIPL